MTPLDVDALSDAYLEIVDKGLEHLRRYSLRERFAYLDLEIEHLHNLSSYIGDTNLYRHAYYYCAERPFYLERIRAIEGFDTSVVVSRYIEPWNRILNLLLPFADEIDAKDYMECLAR